MPLIGALFLIRTAWKRLRGFDRNITAGRAMLTPDYGEFIRSLNDNAVRYLVVGGYAVALHGHPRYTKEFDIWVDLERDSAERIVRALDTFGFGSLGLKPQDFLEADQVVQLGYPPNRIDLITSLPGVEFEACYAARLEVALDQVKVNFIDLENLRKNKQASGQFQDLADLENLE